MHRSFSHLQTGSFLASERSCLLWTGSSSRTTKKKKKVYDSKKIIKNIFRRQKKLIVSILKQKFRPKYFSFVFIFSFIPIYYYFLLLELTFPWKKERKKERKNTLTGILKGGIRWFHNLNSSSPTFCLSGGAEINHTIFDAKWVWSFAPTTLPSRRWDIKNIKETVEEQTVKNWTIYRP